MLTIIHGTDIAASRKFFLEQRQKHTQTVSLDEMYVTLTDLYQILEGGSFFEESKYLFIEQFLTKRKKSAEKNAIIDYLIKHSASHHIFLWEGKELDRSSLSSFKTAQIQVFKLPSTLFLFLDSLKPKNQKQMISLFHKTLETTESEMIFFMLVRQFRILLALSQAGKNEIDELKRVATWQRGKFKKQAASFGLDRLKELYGKLFTIELGQKTGSLSSPLVSAIDFFLLGI